MCSNVDVDSQTEDKKKPVSKPHWSPSFLCAFPVRQGTSLGSFVIVWEQRKALFVVVVTGTKVLSVSLWCQIGKHLITCRLARPKCRAPSENFLIFILLLLRQALPQQKGGSGVRVVCRLYVLPVCQKIHLKSSHGSDRPIFPANTLRFGEQGAS